MRKVIVNSTPLISLCKVGLLDLLKKQYGEITVPEAVFYEITRKNDDIKRLISESEWIHIERIKEDKSKRMQLITIYSSLILAEDSQVL